MDPRGSNKWGGDAWAINTLSASGPPPAGERRPAAAVQAPDRVGTPGAATGRLQGRWSRSPNVVDRRTLLGVMVLPAEGAAVVLTGVAAEVWRALAVPATGDQLAERLAGGGDAGPTPGDIADALRDLQARGAVREMR